MNRRRSPAEMLRNRSRGMALRPHFHKIQRENAPSQRELPANRSPYDGFTSNAIVVAQTPTDADREDPRLKRMRLEAVLLLAKTPLTTRKLAQLADLADGTEARTLLRDLNQTYEMHRRGLRVEQVAGGYRLMTRASLAPWLVKLGHLPSAIRLSTPMMETLAVVAYRQPVSRASAEAVRGVACGELLRQLMERDLIRIAGRSEELGRPYLYGTTKRFLQLFGLPSVDALPPISWNALHEDPELDSDDSESTSPDSTPEELSTPTKESVVSTTVAPILSESQTITTINGDETINESEQEAVAVIEDEEDELWEGTSDDDLDDDDDDDIDDQWDDEDDLDDDDLDDDEDDDDLDDDSEDLDDLDDDQWQEVDDDDDEDWDDDDDDDEDWDDDDGEGDDDDDDEDWD